MSQLTEKVALGGVRRRSGVLLHYRVESDR
jgi:hypothetical protein